MIRVAMFSWNKTGMTISELLNLHGSDKNTTHSYGPVYDQLLSPMRESCRCVIELGIGEGGSLRAWRDFFPNAVVIGVDRDERRMVEEKRIRSICCDFYQLQQLITEIGSGVEPGTVDLIIDDGPHDAVQQLACMLALWRMLRVGGYYVIEDCQGLHEHFDGEFPQPDVIHDLRHLKERCDDLLYVYRRHSPH